VTHEAVADATESSSNSAVKADDPSVVNLLIPAPGKACDSAAVAKLSGTEDAVGETFVISKGPTPAAKAIVKPLLTIVDKSQPPNHQDPPFVSLEVESPVVAEQGTVSAQSPSPATLKNQENVAECPEASCDPAIQPDDSPTANSPAPTPAKTTENIPSTTADASVDQPATETGHTASVSHPKDSDDQPPPATASPAAPDCSLAAN